MARKSGIIAGIIALILAFFSEIPIYPQEGLTLLLNIFSSDKTAYFYWGYRSGNSGKTLITSPSPENLVALAVWVIILLTGILSIMASSTNANSLKSAKIYKVNVLLLVALLFIFGFIIWILIYPDFSDLITIIGYGYYLTIIVLLLNLVALNKLTKKEEG